MRKGHRKEFLLTPEQMKERYLAGEIPSHIAKLAGTDYATVQRRLKDLGVELRGHQMSQAGKDKLARLRTVDLPEDRLREFHAAGMSVREMATALDAGVHEETIRERLIRMGLDRLAAKARPEHNYFWRGGLTVDRDGYILEKTPDHPRANRSGYVRQHRLVMERELGRHLLPTEVVDHRNGDQSDNRIENLRLFASNSDHLHATLTGRGKMPRPEREALRQEAVQRARRRVEAILRDRESGAAPSP